METSTIRRRRSLPVRTAYTGVAAANIGGMTLRIVLEVNGIVIEVVVPGSSWTRLLRDW